jgi:hypothetical protein
MQRFGLKWGGRAFYARAKESDYMRYVILKDVQGRERESSSAETLEGDDIVTHKKTPCFFSSYVLMLRGQHMCPSMRVCDVYHGEECF